MAIQPIALQGLTSDPSQFGNGFEQGRRLQLAQNQDKRAAQSSAFEAQNQGFQQRQRSAQILANGLDLIEGEADPTRKAALFDRYKGVAAQLDPDNAASIAQTSIDDLPLYKQAVTQEMTALQKFQLEQAKAEAPLRLAGMQLDNQRGAQQIDLGAQQMQAGQLNMQGQALQNQGLGLDLETKRQTNDYWANLAGQESGGNPAAANPRSSATGTYQFTDPTWRSVAATPEGRAAGLTVAGKNDPQQQEIGARILTAQNTAALEAAGIPATQKTAYLAHFLGPAGAVAMIKANPNASAADILPDAAASNPSIFYKGKGQPRTAGEVIALQTQRFPDAPVGGAPAAAAAPAAQDPTLAAMNDPVISQLAARQALASRAGDTATAKRLQDVIDKRLDLIAPSQKDQMELRKLTADTTVAEKKASGEGDPSFRMTQKTIDTLGKVGEGAIQFNELASGFRDDFGGYGSGTLGDADITMQRKLGTSFGSSDDAAAWWSQYQNQKNLIRNQLFGSALTETEKAEFDKANISPGMTAPVIKENLKRQQDVANRAARKQAATWISQGAGRQAVQEAMGVESLRDIGIPDDYTGRGTATKTDAPAAAPVTLGSDPDAEYERLASGTQFIGPDGLLHRKP